MFPQQDWWWAITMYGDRIPDRLIPCWTRQWACNPCSLLMVWALRRLQFSANRGWVKSLTRLMRSRQECSAGRKAQWQRYPASVITLTNLAVWPGTSRHRVRRTTWLRSRVAIWKHNHNAKGGNISVWCYRARWHRLRGRRTDWLPILVESIVV